MVRCARCGQELSRLKARWLGRNIAVCPSDCIGGYLIESVGVFLLPIADLSARVEPLTWPVLADAAGVRPLTPQEGKAWRQIVKHLSTKEQKEGGL